MAEKMYGLNVSVGDELRAQMFRAVLEYEAMQRGLTQGQALVELVLEAVDISSYPQEVRTRLDEIAEHTRRAAVEKALAVTNDARIT